MASSGKKKNDSDIVFRPLLLNPAKTSDRKELRRLLKSSHVRVRDDVRQQLFDLFLVSNPLFKKDPVLAKTLFEKQHPIPRKRSADSAKGRWAYFPWNHTLVHILEPGDFFTLRTARNRDLITESEQRRLKEARVHIAGLSVGSSAALALALEGFENFLLSDFDKLEIPNLNRIIGSVSDVGLNKAVISARRIYEINPYANVSVLMDGLNSVTLKKFVHGPPKPDVILDEMDDLAAKVELRLLARASRLPVVSIADNGDGAVADVERFDGNPNRPLFHGLLGNTSPKELSQMKFSERIKLINRIVGVEYVTERMKSSLLSVGTKIYSWPQLGGAAMLSGSVAAYLLKSIVLGGSLKSGKYDVSLDRVFTPRYDSPVLRQRRKRKTAEFLKHQEKMFT